MSREPGRPRVPEAWERLGDTYLELGEAVEAEKRYLHALAACPAEPEAQLGLARVDVALGKTEEARGHLDRALEAWAPADPSCQDAHAARSLLEKLGQP